MIEVYRLIPIVLCLMVMSISGLDESPEAVEKWFQELSKQKQTVTRLHFFLHETNGGTYGKTIYRVVQPDISLNSPTSFGKISMFDDPLKEGSDPESAVVGSAQGFTSSSSLEENSLLMTLHFVFTTGKYNDSTLSIIGRNPLMNQYREFAIVGGSGVFRLASGIVTAQTTSMDPDTHDLIVEYNLLVFHYDISSSASIMMNADRMPYGNIFNLDERSMECGGRSWDT